MNITQKTGTVPYRNAPSMRARKPARPYRLALFTALIAGVLSAGISYFIFAPQATEGVSKRGVELRKELYRSFLANVSNDPLTSKLFAMGAVAEKSSTDKEIQLFEDEARNFLVTSDFYDRYLRLQGDMNIMGIGASERVRMYSDDILKAMSFDFEAIDIKRYPPDIQKYYFEWYPESRHNGSSPGVEERLTKHERFSLILLSKLLQNLIGQMSQELREHYS